MSAKITAVRILNTVLKVQVVKGRCSPMVNTLDLKLFDDGLHRVETAQDHFQLFFIYPSHLHCSQM